MCSLLGSRMGETRNHNFGASYTANRIDGVSVRRQLSWNPAGMHELNKGVDDDFQIDPERMVVCVVHLKLQLSGKDQSLVVRFGIRAAGQYRAFVRVPNRRPVR